MNTMIPFRKRRELSNPFFDDSLFRSLFDANDMLAQKGFRVDIKETPEAYELKAELPGVSREQINVNVENDVLTISADIESEKKEKEENYVYSERRFGHVERSFTLEGIRQEDISASCTDGILTVILPKEKAQEGKTSRRIEVA